MGSTTRHREMMGSSTPGDKHDGMMGSTTPKMMGIGIMGKVVTISGTTLTVTGRGAKDTATTTYTVDASAARIIKGKTASSTVADIAVGDRVMVGGQISGTSVTAKIIIDGLAVRPVMQHDSMNGMHMGSSTGDSMTHPSMEHEQSPQGN
jgi:hypothetical protein